MKLLVLIGLGVAAAMAKPDLEFSVTMNENMIKAMSESFLSNPKLAKKMYDAVDNLQGPQIPPCDQSAWVTANRNFHDKLGLPVVVFPYRVVQKLAAEVVGKAYDGSKNIASYVNAYVAELGENIGCFHPANLRNLGYPYALIVPQIIIKEMFVSDAIYNAYLDDGGYACAVETAIDEHAEDLVFIFVKMLEALKENQDPCRAIRTFLFGVFGIFAGVNNANCGSGVGSFAYEHFAAPARFLFPQCNIPKEEKPSTTAAPATSPTPGSSPGSPDVTTSAVSSST